MIVLDAVLTLDTYLRLLEQPRFWQGLACDACRSMRLHGHGRYKRKGLLTQRGDEPLVICRVRCVDCERAPSIIPLFAASGPHAIDEVVEEAVAYVSTRDCTYHAAGARIGVAGSTLHRWVTRVGRVALTAVIALLARLRPDIDPLTLIPKVVPAESRARSVQRAELVRTALQVLVAGRHCAEELVRGSNRSRPSTLQIVFRGGGSHMT